MIQFEFHTYSADMHGSVSVEPNVTIESFRSDSSARSHAGTLAKKSNGPVDVAFAHGGEWGDRYITTAAPSEFHTKGYRFERLA